MRKAGSVYEAVEVSLSIGVVDAMLSFAVHVCSPVAVLVVARAQPRCVHWLQACPADGSIVIDYKLMDSAAGTTAVQCGSAL